MDEALHSNSLSHIDQEGKAKMVDVGEKPITRRSATARALFRMNAATAEQVRKNAIKKGDVIPVARLAGIMAAKQTGSLIPLCHIVSLDSVSVEFQWSDATTLEILATASCNGRTGVEMEALVAASLASLTVYDMCKSSDREMRIESIEVIRKTGGLSGNIERH
jgi:cyclic pyranopterin phosphate synthase